MRRTDIESNEEASAVKMRWFVSAVVVLLLGVMIGSASAEYDLGGRTVRFGLFSHEITPFAPRGQESFFEPHGRLLGHIQEVEERFNVTLEWAHHPSHASLMEDIPPQVLVGETDFDIYQIRRQEMMSLASEGLLWPLDDFLGPDYRERLPRLFRNQQYTDFQGRTYMINNFKFPGAAMALLWNVELFEEYGLPNLYDLVEAGEWTWDALLEIVNSGVMDRTGDGETDLWAINDGTTYATGQPGSTILEFAITNNTDVVKEVDGRLVVNVLDDAFLEAAQLVQDLKRIQNTPDLGSWAQYLEFTRGNYLMHINATGAVDWPDLKNSDVRVGVVPMPMGPRASGYIYPMWRTWGVAIPITVQDPEAIVEIILQTYLVTSDYHDVDAWEEDYYENQVAHMFHDRQSIQHHIDGLTYGVTSPYWFSVLSPELRDAFSAILHGEKSPAVAFGEISHILQALLDEEFEQ